MLTWRQNSGDHATLVTVTSISSSPTPTPIRKNTPLAAFNWNTNNIQVFYKLQDGSIRSRGNDGLKWEGGSPQITNLKPRDDSGLAVVGWFSDNVEQVCTVSITPSLSILILCFRYEYIPWVKATLYGNPVGIVVPNHGPARIYLQG